MSRFYDLLGVGFPVEQANMLGGNSIIINPTPISSSTIGSTLVTNGNFSGSLTGWTSTGWTYSSGTALHTSGNTSALSQTVTVENAVTYLLTYTTSGTFGTGQSHTASVNGTVVTNYNTIETESPTTGGVLPNSGIYVATTSGPVTLAFTPTNTFTAAISAVSLKKVSNPVTPVLTLSDSTPTDFFEIRGSQTLHNLGLGRNSSFLEGTGTNNIAIGERALALNVSGIENVALGNLSLTILGSGYGNTAVGYATGTNISSGFSCTLIGHNAGNFITAGAYNTYVGESAGYETTIGFSNTGVGVNALYGNTTGQYNVGIGSNANLSNSIGNGNVAIGIDCLHLNTADYNNAVGLDTMFNNTTGTLNCAFGDQALQLNISGSTNMAFGHSTLQANTIGSDSIAIGSQSLTNSVANTNIGIGTLAGSIGGNNFNLSGIQNIWIGYRAGPNVDRLTPVNNSIGIGHQAHNTKSNEVQLGNTSHTETQLYGSVVAGTRAALLTTAVDGFLYIPTCAGTPTGVATAKTGMAPLVVDSTNNKLYFYSSGSWRDAGP